MAAGAAAAAVSVGSSCPLGSCSTESASSTDINTCECKRTHASHSDHLCRVRLKDLQGRDLESCSCAERGSAFVGEPESPLGMSCLRTAAGIPNSDLLFSLTWRHHTPVPARDSGAVLTCFSASRGCTSAGAEHCPVQV